MEASCNLGYPPITNSVVDHECSSGKLGMKDPPCLVSLDNGLVACGCKHNNGIAGILL